MQNLNLRLVAEIIGGALFVLLVIWFFFLRTPGLEPTDTAAQQTFGTGDERTQVSPTASTGNDGAGVLESPVSQQRVFKISDGPVAGATFMQEARPTTTVARFVMQQNGHVLDLAIDSPGSVARAISNTTIPGAKEVVWEIAKDNARQVAQGAILRYIDQTIIKSVLLLFPQSATTTSVAAVRIQFLPDNILSLAASPDGASVVYLVATAAGSDGYVARADGTNPKKLFSLPLTQMTVQWPSVGTILATTKAATGVPGMAFSISAASGAVSPILYASGITTTADFGFNQVVYQSANGATRFTYAHNTKTNLDRSLSFDPMPDKCIWSRLQTSTMFCAVPLTYIVPEYNDLWYQGADSAADSIVSYNLITGKNTVLATPGAEDGGTAADIAHMALSADEKYLLFVKKGDRSLWGVRLAR